MGQLSVALGAEVIEPLMKYRLAKLHCAGTDFWGYLLRGKDEPRTRYNTWNGWECPVLSKQQLLDFIKLQNWRLYEGECVDTWKFVEEDGRWGVLIMHEDDPGEYYDPWLCYNIETEDGETIEVVSTPCYCFESGWGTPGETYTIEEYNYRMVSNLDFASKMPIS